MASSAGAAAVGKRSRREERDKHPEMRLAVLVLAYCGLRWGELAALRVRRVDLMRRRIQVAEAITEFDGMGLVWVVPRTMRFGQYRCRGWVCCTNW